MLRARHQGAGPQVGHFHPQPLHQQGGGTRHAGMQDVPHDEHALAPYLRKHLPDGEGVQQRLGGMGMGPVPGVDHAGAGMARNHIRQAAVVMAHDHVIHLHGLERGDRVLHGFPLHHGRGGHREVGHVRGQAFRRYLKGGAGAGAGLIKKRQNGLPFQGRHLFDAFGEELLHRTGRIQQRMNFLVSQRGDVEKVLAGIHGKRVMD